MLSEEPREFLPGWSFQIDQKTLDYFRPMLERIALTYLTNPADVDDVIQEVWVRATVYRAAEKVHRNAQRKWLRTTVGRVCLDFKWKNTRRHILIKLAINARTRHVTDEEACRAVDSAINDLVGDKYDMADWLREGRKVTKFGKRYGMTHHLARRLKDSTLETLRHKLRDYAP